MYAPSDGDLLPFDTALLGDLRLCVQQFPTRESVQSFQNWRRVVEAVLRGRRGQGVLSFSCVAVPHLGMGGVPSQLLSSQSLESSCSGSGAVDGDAGPDGVVELPHGQERLAMIQVIRDSDSRTAGSSAGFSQAGRTGGSCDSRHAFEVQRPRRRGRSPCGVHSSGQSAAAEGGNMRAQDRGRSQECLNRPRELSPAPMCSWGTRFASRFRLCSLDLAGTISSGSDERLGGSCANGPGGTDLGGESSCGSVVSGCWGEKRIEVLLPPRAKVVVSEEFPERCSWTVLLPCITAELRCLENRLGSATAGLNGCARNIDDAGCVTAATFRAPECMRALVPCTELRVQDDTYTLADVGWPVFVDLAQAVCSLTVAHQACSSMLQVFDNDQASRLKECEDAVMKDAGRLEGELRFLRSVECEGFQRLEASQAQCDNPFKLRSVALGDAPGGLGQLELEPRVEPSRDTSTDSDDPPPLQTKIVSQDQVRREPQKWREALVEELQSLIQKTQAVEDISEQQYLDLARNPQISVELIPGKVVYNHKSSGRRKARIVGCGNFCQSDTASQKEDLFASGVGSESIRMIVRRAALDPSWELVSVDVRTAFLQAPLIETQYEGRQKVTIVKVPSILREQGITEAKYWRVKKALYGLASAPKSWSVHRDRVLASLRIPCGDKTLRLVRMLEDANLWHIVQVSSQSGESQEGHEQKLGAIALYVDDILIGGSADVTEAVVRDLQAQWELSAPEKLTSAGDYMKFAGYELVRTEQGYRLHQSSYARDILDQYCDEIPGTETTPAVKMYKIPDEFESLDPLSVTRKAQAIIGQLL